MRIHNKGRELDWDWREDVSYAIGDPLGEFSYIPHAVFEDGSVWLPKESVKLLWEWHHTDWLANRFKEDKSDR